MHKTSSYLLALAAVCIGVSCNKSSDSSSDEESGNWIKRSSFGGAQRTEAASFVIGDTAYVGTGYDGENRLKDFWLYNADGNTWQQRAVFRGTARNSAVGFSANGKGYIATGYDGVNKLKDVWRYDPSSNSWDQMNDFAGSARYDAAAFSIADKGYITTGYADLETGGSGNVKDCWQYNPGSDSWTEKNNFGGDKRNSAVVFVYQDKAYLCTGTASSTLNDFYAYDPSTDTWTEKRKIANISDESYDDDYSDIIRSNAVAFTLGDYAYISTGTNGSNTTKTWRYHFADDTWSRKTPFEGSSRGGAVAFVVKNRAFVTMGSSGSSYFDDIWEFNPDQTQNDDDN
ncbi:Kelch repeat-containing protein [Foetidibacter luteolus]|uniref:Kelch repeat-containing protein n=1 Tax=Foetidibacter luteolus TaxID=2608880 RepID=UPI00129A7027|nr:kelch repeat-containing protein [Foetidibacter luteolus]